MCPVIRGLRQDFITEREDLPGYSKATIQVYRTAQNHYLRYVKGTSIEFADLDREHLSGFVKHLRKKNLQDNTVHKMMSTLRTIIYEANNKGLHNNQRFSLKDLNVSRQDSDSIYLNSSELKQIEQLDLSQNLKLANIRDLFLLASWTSLRLSDLSKINSENIHIIEGKEILSVLPKKTKRRVEIPVHPTVKRILTENNGKPPKKISDQKYNEYLKELCKLLEMNDLIEIKKSPGGRLTTSKLQKWQLVSSHTARRSFSTNAYLSDMPIPAIMKITGHRSPTVFLKYIRMDNEENAVRMADHPFFKQLDF